SPWTIQPVEIPASRQQRKVRWELPAWELPADGSELPRLTIPVEKTLLHPGHRDQLLGNGDVRLLQVLALGLHATTDDPELDIGVVDGDYGPRTQAAV